MSSLTENSYAMAGRYMRGLPFSRKKKEKEKKVEQMGKGEQRLWGEKGGKENMIGLEKIN